MVESLGTPAKRLCASISSLIVDLLDIGVGSMEATGGCTLRDLSVQAICKALIK